MQIRIHAAEPRRHTPTTSNDTFIPNDPLINEQESIEHMHPLCDQAKEPL